MRKHAELTCRVEVVTSLAAVGRHIEHWQRLSENAVDQNVFYEPWNLIPALETIKRNSRLRLLFIYADSAQTSRLVAFFPFEVLWHYKHIPVRHLKLLAHKHCFLTAPLVDQEFESETLDSFADWIAREERGTLVELADMSSNGSACLVSALRKRGLVAELSKWKQRAFFRPAMDSDTYLQSAFTKKKRKDLRRVLNRLSECGELEYRALASNEDASPWIDDFLKLESRGWKGRAGSAMIKCVAQRRYFEDAARGAHERQKLDMTGYYLDGRPIALSCKYLSGEGAFAYKICFDEKYRQYSPGLLLELRYINQLHESDRIRWLDSCAEPDHFMANRLWMERRRLDTITIVSGRYAKLVLTLVKFLRAAKLHVFSAWGHRSILRGLTR